MNSRLLDKLGLAGVAGIGLLLFCLSFLLGNYLPARAEVLERESELASLRAAVGAGKAPSALRAPLPGVAQLPDVLTRLNALAEQQGIGIERTTYQLKGSDGQRRLELSMPLRATYPALRAYLREAVAQTAGASLDELTLQRTQATEPTVDAQVRLSFRFAAAP